MSERVGRRRVRALSILAIVGVIGCGSSHPSTAGNGTAGEPSEPWRAALDRLASGGSSTYSFRFMGPPPLGSFYTFAVHDTDVAAACRRYDLSATARDDDFWYVAVTVNDGLAGDHPIRTKQRTGEALATANLTLLHRRENAFVEAYDALAGSVTVIVNPTTEGANAGERLEGRIDAEFPTRPLFEERCGGGGPADGGPSTFECDCVDPHGVRSKCVPSGEETCCRDSTSATFRVSIPFVATHCPSMCRIVAGSTTNYCYEFFRQ